MTFNDVLDKLMIAEQKGLVHLAQICRKKVAVFFPKKTPDETIHKLAGHKLERDKTKV
jgi:hypothetical protein